MRKVTSDKPDVGTKATRGESTIGLGFYTAYPEFRRLFREMMKTLFSHGDPYIPDKVALGRTHGFRAMPFTANRIDEFVGKWEEERPEAIWIFSKDRPIQLSLSVGGTPGGFNLFDLTVESDYFKDIRKASEMIVIGKELYDLLHPAYGNILSLEMIEKVDSPLGKVTPGTNIRRALPDVFWVNFFGPEYVEMFGGETMFSSPCLTESLHDGGALLMLSSSPLDFLSNPAAFRIRRQQVKVHLGTDAFDTGDPMYRGKVPKFRYLEERARTLARPLSEAAIKSSDWIAAVGREEWERWVRDNSSIAIDFAHAMDSQGVKLDFSEHSLTALDAYLHGLHQSSNAASVDSLKELAAYVAQVIISSTGATWSFRGSKDVPSLWLGDVQISPLAKAQKVILEGETFEQWYQFITRELLPAISTDKGHGT